MNSDGIPIAYSVEGSGDETILLVVGLGCRAADWGETFPARLAERYRVVRFDNRGTGDSGSVNNAFTLDDLARDAVRVLDAVDAARAHIVGLSMGGMISQLIALDHAERCDRLILLSTNAGGPEVVPPASEALALFQPPRDETAEQAARRALQVLTGPGFAEKQPRAVEALVSYAVRQPTSRRAFAAQLQAIFGSDRAARLKDIKAPTLVVHGDSDLLIPLANGEYLAKHIPGARLAVLENCGHYAMWEASEELAGLVLDFVSSNPAR